MIHPETSVPGRLAQRGPAGGGLDTEREAFGNSYHESGLLICHPDERPAAYIGTAPENGLCEACYW
jgi:hypothetical protein